AARSGCPSPMRTANSQPTSSRFRSSSAAAKRVEEVRRRTFSTLDETGSRSVSARAHVPVLLDEVMQALDVKPESVVVDATYGRGGHAEAIMRRLSAAGRLLLVDRDPDAIADARR